MKLEGTITVAERLLPITRPERWEKSVSKPRADRPGRKKMRRIIGPADTMIPRTALQNAASIAGLMITTEALITDIPEEEKAPPMPGGGGMGGMY